MNVDLLPVVLRFDVAGNREIGVVRNQFRILHQPREVRHLLPLDERFENLLPIRLRELVLVPLPHELRRSVDEEHAVVRLALLQHDDAGRNRRPEKEIRRQLNHRVDIIVLQQIFPDLRLRPAPVEHPGEFDDRRRPRSRKPRKHVHRERQIRLRFRRKHPRRRKARIVDEQRI